MTQYFHAFAQIMHPRAVGGIAIETGIGGGIGPGPGIGMGMDQVARDLEGIPIPMPAVGVATTRATLPGITTTHQAHDQIELTDIGTTEELERDPVFARSIAAANIGYENDPP